jgi:hypothetical protein
MVAGRAVATWSLTRRTVMLSELEPITAADRAALDTEAIDLVRFLA